jgi:fluoroacetyl-CoA thioesterase
MKESLKAGLKHSFAYVVPETKTVPRILPESAEFQAMPQVFATGFMVALVEWTCVQLTAPHLDMGEGSLGTGVDLSHIAATPPGFTVTVDAELAEVNGRRLTFKVRAHDGADLIGEGWHERTVVEWDRFNRRVGEKAQAVHKGC